MKRKRISLGVFLLIAVAMLSPGGVACADDAPRRVLILSAYNYTLPSATQVIDGVEKRLNELGEKKFVIDAEFLDLVRAADSDHEFRTATYVREKYANKPPDIVIVIGGTALQFFMKYRDIVGSQIPVVFAGVAPTTFSTLHVPPNITGILFKLDLEKTLDLAEHLQPNARQLFVIAGSSPVEDRNWQQAARRTIEQRERTYQTTYLFGLSFDALISEVSKLPSDAIVVMLSFLLDGDGSNFIGRDVATEVARVSPAPVYAPYDIYIGNGVVGGFVETFESHGAAAADLVSEISDGKDPATLPPRVNPAQTFRVDSRALDRWHLNRNALPSGSVVLFRRASIWEQHRYLVSAVMLVFALQSLIVATLLVQRRRRQFAERSLRESEDRMTFTAASVNAGLWQFDRAADELWAMDSCRAMFGLAADVSLTRETFLAALHPEDRRVAVDALRGVLKAQQSAMTDVRVILPDKQIRWIRVRIRARAGNQRISDQLSGLFVDITDQKAAESEAELQRQQVTHLMRVSVLGELSGAIAHEINQPLTAILSNAQAALYLLNRNSTDLTEVRGALLDIVQENKRAGDVIQRLRGLLKNGEVKSESVDINELVGSTIALLRGEMVDRRVSAKTQLAAWLPAVCGDPVQLQQVLLNLVMNGMDAMVATPVAKRRIDVSTQMTLTGSIEVAVKDCGPGIQPMDGDRVFTPFFTTKDHGLGLGLTISTAILQKHGGSLTLRNHGTGGAVARIALPVPTMLAAAQ